jgi:hypothetical protein
VSGTGSGAPFEVVEAKVDPPQLVDDLVLLARRRETQEADADDHQAGSDEPARRASARARYRHRAAGNRHVYGLVPAAEDDASPRGSLREALGNR